MERHEQVCTFAIMRAIPNTMGAIAPEKGTGVKEETRSDEEDILTNEKSIRPLSGQSAPFGELNSRRGLRLKRSSSLLKYSNLPRMELK